MVESLSSRVQDEQRRFDISAEREQGAINATVKNIGEAESRVAVVVKRCEDV